MMWHELLLALALVLVIEGILPFASPAAWRQAALALARWDDTRLRLLGLTSMLCGLALLYLVR